VFLEAVLGVAVAGGGRRREGALLLAALKRVAAGCGQSGVRGRGGEVAGGLVVCLVDAVLVVLVVVAPVVAVVGILLGLHPLGGLGAVHIGLEADGLGGRKGRCGAVAGRCQ